MFMKKTMAMGDNASTTAVSYDQSENTIRFYFGTTNPASDHCK